MGCPCEAQRRSCSVRAALQLVSFDAWGRECWGSFASNLPDFDHACSKHCTHTHTHRARAGSKLARTCLLDILAAYSEFTHSDTELSGINVNQ
eukprot:4161420-Amphidinium_carterae.1